MKKPPYFPSLLFFFLLFQHRLSLRTVDDDAERMGWNFEDELLAGDQVASVVTTSDESLSFRSGNKCDDDDDGGGDDDGDDDDDNDDYDDDNDDDDDD